jgi:hypothetical protein
LDDFFFDSLLFDSLLLCDTLFLYDDFFQSWAYHHPDRHLAASFTSDNTFPCSNIYIFDVFHSFTNLCLSDGIFNSLEDLYLSNGLPCHATIHLLDNNFQS